MRTSRRALPILVVSGLLAAAAAHAQPQKFEPPSERQKQLAAHQLLVNARALVRQGRPDDAVATLRRALLYSPDHAGLHALLANTLADLGREDEARVHRERADAISPPPPPVPDEPLVADAAGLLVLLVPPAESDEPRERIAPDWPDGVPAATLAERLATRLPGATLVYADPDSIEAARRQIPPKVGGVLSLRVERAYCRDTVKDGAYAVAWLRVAAETAGAPSEGPDDLREVVFDPRAPGDCRAEALARGLERVLRFPNVTRTLAARSEGKARSGLSNAALRSLFPGLGHRIQGLVESGRTRLASGNLAAAREAFATAAQIDPEDPIVAAYLHEVDATLAIASELETLRDPDRVREEDRGLLDPRFSPEQRAAAEARLAEAKREREELLAAHKALDDDFRATAAADLERLHHGEILDPEAFGPKTARARSGGDVEVRVAYTPRGDPIARWYVATGGSAAILREEDIDGDGDADRWLAFRDGVRHEIWEDTDASGSPDLHILYAPGGERLERVDVSAGSEGRGARTLRYADGVLESESRDRDANGVPDRIDHFDANGDVRLREEDLDGDGEIDVRSHYRSGRLVERELRSLELAPDDA